MECRMKVFCVCSSTAALHCIAAQRRDKASTWLSAVMTCRHDHAQMGNVHPNIEASQSDLSVGCGL